MSLWQLLLVVNLCRLVLRSDHSGSLMPAGTQTECLLTGIRPCSCGSQEARLDRIGACGQVPVQNLETSKSGGSMEEDVLG